MSELCILHLIQWFSGFRFSLQTEYPPFFSATHHNPKCRTKICNKSKLNLSILQSRKMVFCYKHKFKHLNQCSSFNTYTMAAVDLAKTSSNPHPFLNMCAWACIRNVFISSSVSKLLFSYRVLYNNTCT